MMGGGCTTPPEVTGAVEVGVHWFRAVTQEPVYELVDRLAGVLQESVEIRDTGMHGYSETFVLGGVKVWHNPARRDMGACIEVSGDACEELGRDGLLAVWDAADWRVARVDLAVDRCPFTPGDLRREWLAGQVDTRVKVLDPEGGRAPRAGREGWRRCEWSEQPDGDMFAMGSRAAGQYARCYDRRGFTRFELELKKATAHAAGPRVMEALRSGRSAFAVETVSLIQRFVRFVDRGSVTNVTRAVPLGFWAAFVRGIEKSRLRVGERVVRTVEEVVGWVERQVAPSLAIVERVLGVEALGRVIREGRRRWGPRQLETLRLAGIA